MAAGGASACHRGRAEVASALAAEWGFNRAMAKQVAVQQPAGLPV